MNFIETYFHVSPDKGDGSIEALIVVALFMLIVTLAMRVGTGHSPKKEIARSVTRVTAGVSEPS